MRPFPPEDGLELIEAHAALELGILRDLLIGGERLVPISVGKGGYDAYDRLPLGDGETRACEARSTSDHHHDDNQERERGEPDAERPRMLRRGGFTAWRSETRGHR